MIALWHWSQKYDGKITRQQKREGESRRWGSNGRRELLVSLPKQVFPYQIPGIFIALEL
jgi:hypothetical protein